MKLEMSMPNYTLIELEFGPSREGIDTIKNSLAKKSVFECTSNVERYQIFAVYAKLLVYFEALLGDFTALVLIVGTWDICPKEW